MTRKSKIQAVILTIFLLTLGITVDAHHSHEHKKYSKKHKVAAAAAPIAVGAVAGPAGSLTYGGIKHRHRLTHGSAGSRFKTAGSIAAPVAAGVALGPAGTVGYEGIKHHKWISKHLKPHHHHYHHHHEH
ncbi:MAG TPA: hypothetical protein VFC63_06925 [Blastocatellia bacterium]|nr:hypothetical protein [Blastocatellia bacterium]